MRISCVKNISAALAAVILLLCAASPSAAKPSSNINVLVGTRKMVDSGWQTNGTVEAYTLGVDFDFTKDDWPVSLNVGLLGTRDSASKVNLDTNLDVQEIALGARMYLGDGRGFVRPYVGTGLEIMSVALGVNEGAGARNSNSMTTGYFVNVGAFLNFLGVVNVGLDWRWIGGTNPGNEMSKMDYYQGSFIIGMSL
ncbi:MAG: hypothetical protein OEY50_07795 [Nitrospinota bacterium]|nr:hypothetical protein [Nitrospinota bacterium]MDH5677896.1 hypothetical protein [Nitrospinota bacterium]MDH5756559.1 hypothetical protein [Nitrospinota bacterium]